MCVNFTPPEDENVQDEAEKLRMKVRTFLDEAISFIEEFERYRESFKKNKKSLFLHNDEINDFKEKARNFNKFLENVTSSITDELSVDGIEKLQLQLLTNLQLAQIKSTRVHTRINKCRIEESENKIKHSENNLKNVYAGFISVIGIFLSVFVLVSVNINFFQYVTKEKTIDDLILFFVLVNSTAIISVTFLVALVHNFLFLATRTERDNANKCFSVIVFIAFILLLVSILMIKR